jgi:hypothetical protein
MCGEEKHHSWADRAAQSAHFIAMKEAKQKGDSGDKIYPSKACLQ